MQWRNKPLFRRAGDVKFRTGAEASDLLIEEAHRLDPNQPLFLQTYTQTMRSLAPIFDRNPKLAWVAKTMVEPERMVLFRVAWLDDTGTLRLNRGVRVQYSSSLGPYDGGLHFASTVDIDFVKATAFDALCSNSLAGLKQGAAAGGSDFDPYNKSEAEIQRFCQSYMTELSKYIGPQMDMPGMGTGVGTREIGYLYGQYKRVNHTYAQKGRGLLWGGVPPFPHAAGHGVAHFAETLLQAKGDSLQGKRVLITGSGQVALAVADKVLDLGGIPLTLSDTSGHVYEEDGLDAAKLGTIKKIKADRGARIGRYIVSSTTAQFSPPDSSLFAIPCDVCIPCSGQTNEVGEAEATLLADNGCVAVVEGSNMSSTESAAVTFKKRGLLYGPYKAALATSCVASGAALAEQPLASPQALDDALKAKAAYVYAKADRTATEYNCRGDLNAGAQIAAFTQVAEVMLAHGAV